MSFHKYTCLSCDSHVNVLIDFGEQPPSNRFFRLGEVDLDRHNLSVGQCANCMLVQLIGFMPRAMIRSRFDWITYNEPERHLDALMGRLTKLPGISRNSLIAGITYVDATSITRLNRLGFINSFCLDAVHDLGLDRPTTGLESVEAILSEGRIKDIISQHGQVDLLIVRYVLEHAHDPSAFLAGLMLLVKPGGYIVFEVPDSRKFLDACDYSFLWEEHITYFSPATLKYFFEVNGCIAFDIFTYSYPLEDSLVGIVKIEHPKKYEILENVTGEFARAKHFSSEFPKISQRIRNSIGELNSLGKKVAVFGAGHLAVKFLNLNDLGGLIDCVIDDCPQKQGMLMPGSGLPIFSSKLLDEGQIDVCLLSLSPESEMKVIASKKTYLDNGGEFFSIFALSHLAL